MSKPPRLEYGTGYLITPGSDAHAQMYDLSVEYDRCRQEMDIQVVYALDPSRRPKRDVYQWYDPAELIESFRD